ncbi:Germinal-center associated nuclear protein [Lamellibrachia satsuma]|nr:Germinal-center associated nuclear protein [Lamellibrachia satsuma]
MFGTHATSASVFGNPATSASIVGKAASPASIFGKPATSASIFGKPATSASIFGKPATSASIFGKPAAAESKSEKPSIFRKPTTSSGRKSTSTSLFGKPTTTTPIFGNTSSGQVVSSTANVFGQKSARGLLFGKPETVTEETKTGSQLFGKPTGASQGEGRREPKVLFGKKESGKTASADPSGQRRRPGSPPDGGVQKRAALKRQPGTGLFGRAIASVSSERTGEEASGGRVETAPSRPPPPPYSAGEEHKQAEMGSLSPESLQKSGQRRLRRRSSVDVSSLVAISCKNVPTSCNNKLALHKHFSKFGTITRLYMTPSKSTATIHFSDHESAENAKKKGKMIKQGLPPMQIFLSTYSNRGSETGSRTALGSTRMPHSSEVDDELASMRGTSDVSTSGFEGLEQQEKRKQHPSVSFRGHAAGGDVGMAIGRAKRKMDVGLLARGRAGKAKGEERKAAGMKPAASSEVQLEVKPVSMKTLINAVGIITEERLEILNNADKIIRAAKGTRKHADLASAVAIKGSCPDMCPERERYMREFQRRLSVYEIVPGTDGPGQTPAVDHTRAVKEYSRSSADQDMPLPHSVRPPAVLQITMDYLMTNVMDTGGEGRWQDWYDFLWDRTRGIRKDIIQQHLCDLSAADLTEKCTRLHIYCSERLCEEGPNVFDEKINNENLTKCLQSLKELYQDLARQHGISCPNEAEFRAYMVLMNLNEGDTLREVQELCQDVRESAHVRFATSVYAAVNNNNYIKFFKLVQSATFLSACIMHRYFTQVRTKALTIIMKAYCVPGRVIQYPLSDIVRHLAFEDNSEAAEFCSHHGLAVHDGQVAMDRHAFVQPEQAFGARRALHLVESKQTTSVGEVVCGGPLPPSTLHNPTSSFDANNRFHGGDLLVAAMETPATITETPQDRPPTESPPEDLRTQAEAATASLTVNILNEVINEMVQEMCSSLMSDADRYLRSVQSIASEILNDAMVSLARVMCGEVTHELWAEFEVQQQRERAEDDARRRALMSAARDLACGEIVDEIMSTVVAQECSSIAQDQHGEVQRTLQRESSDRCTASLVDQLVAETITAEIGDIAETTYEVDVEDRLRLLDETAKAVELLVKARYFQCWRNQHAGRMRLKRSMLSFPSAPSMKDPPAQFTALLPASEGVSHDSIHLGKKARLTLNSPDQVCANQRRVRLRVALFNYCKRVKHDHAWCPLDMVQVLHRQLTMRQAHATDSKLSRLFWKLVISLPETDGSPADDDHHRCDWLKAKFSKGAVPPNPSLEEKSEVLSLYTVDRHGKERQPLSVYVRTVVGILSECDIETIAKKQLFMGCSALLFLLRAADFSTLDDDFWLEEQLRLKTALLTIPFSSSLPLVIMAPHPLTDHQRQTIAIQLGLDMVLKDGLISCIQVVAMETCVEEPEASRTLVDSVRWLAERCPRQLALKVTPLRDYVEDCLSQDFYTLIFQDLPLRKRNGLLHQNVRAQIALYNSVVCHMVEQVTHPDLANTSWPQFEFTHQDEEHLSADWNSCERFAALEAALLSLRLPQFEFGGEDGEDWEEACEDVREFVAAVTAQGGHDTALLSRTCWILRKLKRQSEDMHLTKQWKLQSRPCHVSVPWTDIILACIDYKMAQLECYDTSEREGNVGQEVKVCYLKDHITPVTLPAAWLEATGAAAEQECVTLGDTVIWQRREDDSASPGLRSRSWTDDIGEKTITTTTNRLLDSIAEEQTASELFENRLRKILQPKMPDELLNISSQDTRDVTAIFGVTSLLSSPVFNLALTSKLDRRQERGGDAGDKCIPRLSLAANVEELNRSVESQKVANSLYEMKLRMYMNEDLLW